MAARTDHAALAVPRAGCGQGGWSFRARSRSGAGLSLRCVPRDCGGRSSSAVAVARRTARPRSRGLAGGSTGRSARRGRGGPVRDRSRLAHACVWSDSRSVASRCRVSAQGQGPARAARNGEGAARCGREPGSVAGLSRVPHARRQRTRRPVRRRTARPRRRETAAAVLSRLAAQAGTTEPAPPHARVQPQC